MANISGTDKDIQNRTSTWLTVIPPTLGKKWNPNMISASLIVVVFSMAMLMH